jgi:hypothetical protein
MRIFVEDNSLQTMNDVFAAMIPQYKLLGDLPLSEKDFSQLASRIELVFGRDGYQRIQYLYKESFSVFLVFCAVYEYEGKVFWKTVEEYLGELSQPRRVELYSIFSSVLDKYNLNHFENESDEGYTYVTPILCHAGIPVNAYDNYFAAISNTVNDSFYDDFDVEDYLFYLKNKTEVTVRRYIKLANQKESYNFIQNTRKLILNNLIDQDDETENGNYTRMSEQISFWKEKPKVKKNLQARSNVQITAPKIKIDVDGLGIYCEIPRIIVKDSYDSYVLWEITSDDSSQLVKADFFRRNSVLVSEEKIITLKPATTYTITLKVDDQQISKWELAGVKDKYIAFLPNGNLIKTEWLPNTSVIFLIRNDHKILNKEELSVAEMSRIPLWIQYDIYSIDLTNLKTLPCSGFTVRVNTENKPTLIGGKTLFNQENSIAYMEMPYIKVPVIQDGEWHLELKHLADNVLVKINAIVSSNREFIELSSYITEDCYGNYDIRVWHKTGITGKFSIEYVPFGMVHIDHHDYWPSSYKGYLNNTHTIRTSPGVELDIYNAVKVSEVQFGDSIIHKYKAGEKDRFLLGEYRYRYNDHAFSTSIKISIHPVSWGINGIQNEIIELTNKVHTLKLNDFSNATDPYLLLAFGLQARDDIRTLTFELIGPNKETVLETIHSIKNKERLRIPLNPYLFEAQNAKTEIDFHLRVSLLDSTDMLVTSFLVARIQDEVIIQNAQYRQNENEIFIKWDETGTQIGREVVLVNFLKPWKKTSHFQIEDKTCQSIIAKAALEEGIYRYVIQKESDNLFSEETEAEICTFVPKDFRKGRIVIEGEREVSSDLEKLLYQLLRTRFIKPEQVSNRLKSIDQDIKSLLIHVPEDIHPLANAYILHERFWSEKDDVQEVRGLFTKLFDLFSSHGKETIKYIIESNYSKEYKRKLLHHFYCNNLTAPVRLNDLQAKLLADIDEDMAGFINLIQAENKTRGLNWAGISDLTTLREEDLFGGRDTNSTFLSDENLGNSTYITSYFKYVSDSLLRPRNFSKTTEDFIREFQRDQSVEETKIFGKTRLHLLVNWKNQNKDENTIRNKLSEVLDIPCEYQLKRDFADAFQALTKRRTDDELGYYVGLIALYASFIRNGQMIDRKEFSRLLHYMIDRCGKLYYRDAIIFELYMSLERGYSWV